MSEIKNNTQNVIYSFWGKRKYLISFVLGAIAYYMFLSYSEVAGGRYSPIFSDSIEIYIPAIRQFCRDILTGQSIFYSWTNSFGMNTIAYNAYNVFSITNLLYLIFFWADIQFITCIVLSIKAGLAAMFFEYYVEKIWKVELQFCVAFSICYTLSAYQISYNLVNFIWMDAFFMLPVILFLLHRISEIRYVKWLIIALAYLFISNFYMAYIVGLFSAIYFLVIVFPYIKGAGNKIKQCLIFGISTISAAFIDAVILLPTAISILRDRAEDASSMFVIDIPIGTVFNQLFFGETQGFTYNTFPNIYCGIFVLVLVPAFFVIYRDSVKMVLGWGALLLIMILSCYVPSLYLFWHAFDVPDGWDWRFSFLISFILCVMASITTKKLKYLEKKYYVLVGIMIFIFYIIYGGILQSDAKYQNGHTLVLGGTNLVLFLLYASLLYLGERKDENKMRAEIHMIIRAVVVVELVANGCIIMNKNRVNDVSSEEYAKWLNDQKYVAEQIKDDGFVRTHFVGSFINNADTMMGVNGCSDFFTVENYRLRNTLSKLGVATSARLVEDFGYTDFTDMILGVKYKIYCESEDKLSGDDGTELSVNDLTLGLGYLVDDDVLECNLVHMNDFDNINDLASAMIGYRLAIFDAYDGKEVQAYENGIQYYSYNEQHVFVADPNVAGGKLISLAIPDNGAEAYVLFGLDEASAYVESPILLNGEENRNSTKGILSERYIKKMDITELGNTVTVYMDDNTFQEAYIQNLFFAYLNEEKMDELYDVLSSGQLEILECKDGYVKGNIFAEKGKVLFTSIPYEEGWTVTSDGKKATIVPVINDTFIAVELSEGEHELEFKYTNPYIKYGVVALCFGLGILAAIIIDEKRKGKDDEEDK